MKTFFKELNNICTLFFYNENIEYIPSCEMENLKKRRTWRIWWGIDKGKWRNDQGLKSLQKQYDLKKEDFAREEIKNLDVQIAKYK